MRFEEEYQNGDDSMPGMRKGTDRSMWTQCWLDYKEDTGKGDAFKGLFETVALPESVDVSAAFEELDKVSLSWL